MLPTHTNNAPLHPLVYAIQLNNQQVFVGQSLCFDHAIRCHLTDPRFDGHILHVSQKTPSNTVSSVQLTLTTQGHTLCTTHVGLTETQLLASTEPVSLPNTQFVYTLQLQDLCYYVGTTSNFCSRYAQHLLGGSQWTHAHPILSIHTIQLVHTPQQGLALENHLTLLHSLQFGPQLVRGGVYCKTRPPLLQELLQYRAKLLHTLTDPQTSVTYAQQLFTFLVDIEPRLLAYEPQNSNLLSQDPLHIGRAPILRHADTLQTLQHRLSHTITTPTSTPKQKQQPKPKPRNNTRPRTHFIPSKTFTKANAIARHAATPQGTEQVLQNLHERHTRVKRLRTRLAHLQFQHKPFLQDSYAQRNLRLLKLVDTRIATRKDEDPSVLQWTHIYQQDPLHLGIQRIVPKNLRLANPDAFLRLCNALTPPSNNNNNNTTHSTPTTSTPIPNDTPDSSELSLQLFVKGYSVDSIARLRALKTHTIYLHLLQHFLSHPHLHLRHFVDLQHVHTPYHLLTWAGFQPKLKPLHERFHLPYLHLRFIHKYVLFHLFHFDVPLSLHSTQDKTQPPHKPDHSNHTNALPVTLSLARTV